jgi:hypothetical protein
MCESLRDGLIINVMRARKQGRKSIEASIWVSGLGFIPSLGDERALIKNFIRNSYFENINERER